MEQDPFNPIYITINRHTTYHLSDAEKKNPYRVFEDLFDIMSLSSFEQLLWKSFLSNILGTYIELTPKEREDIVFVYEKLKKVVQAAHLVNENSKLRELYIRDKIAADEEQEEYCRVVNDLNES